MDREQGIPQYYPEITDNNTNNGCVRVDDFDLQWATACLLELQREGKLATDERDALVGDCLSNS